jgi:hypothetical protein
MRTIVQFFLLALIIGSRITGIFKMRYSAANQMDSEGEITDWVKKELAEARQIPDSELISLEEVRRMILAG